MFFKRKAYENCVNGKKSMQIVTVSCWKVPDEWENRRLQSSLQKMNMKLIF